MIQHIAHLLWNKRNTLWILIVEIAIAFVILFFVATYMTSNIQKYFAPLGFSTAGVYNLDVEFMEDDPELLKQLHTSLKVSLEGHPNVEKAAFHSGSVPWGNSIWISRFIIDSVEVDMEIVNAGYGYFEVLGVPFARGESLSDLYEGQNIAVVNQKYKDQNYPHQPILDSLIFTTNTNEKHKILGIVDHFKIKGDFQYENALAFIPIHQGDPSISGMLFKVKPGLNPITLEQEIHSIVQSTLKHEAFHLVSLDDLREVNNRIPFFLMGTLVFIASFLCLNVILGLFGSLRRSAQSRRLEIGIRKAFGATTTQISGQLISEMLGLMLIALLLGAIFAIQFPIFDLFGLPKRVYYYGFVFAALIILFLVLSCSVYPSRMASRMHPAHSLHQDS